MATNLATAYVEIVPSTKGLGKSIAKELNAADKFTAQASQGMGQKLKSGLVTAAKGAGIAIAGVIGASLAKGWGRLTAIEDAQAKLKGLGHDAGSVEKIMGNALASVKGTAFGLDTAATAAAGAVAAGIKPGAELEGVLKSMANSAAAAGIGMDEMGAIYNKVASQGKAQNDSLQQVADKGIPIYQALADQLGVTTDEVFKMASAGEISFADFEKAMTAASGTVADEMGKTTTGALANLWAALGRFGAGILGGVFPHIAPIFASLTEKVDALAEKVGPLADVVGQKLGQAFQFLVDTFDTWAPILAVVVGALTTYWAVQKAVAIGTAIWNGLMAVKAVVTGGAAAQMQLLNKAMKANPIGFVITLIALLVAGFILAYKKIGWFRDGVNAAWAGIKTAISAVVEWVKTYVWPALVAVWDGISAGALWLWQNAIKPAWDGIRFAIGVVVDWFQANVLPAFQTANTQLGGFFTWLNATVIQPVWAHIRNAIAIVVGWYQTYVVPAFQTAMSILGAVFTWLYQNVVKPVFTGIKMYIQVWWTVTKAIFSAVVWFVKNILAPVFSFLWQAVKIAFQGIRAVIQIAWAIIKGIFSAIVGFVKNVLAPVFTWLWNNVMKPVWNGIKFIIQTWWSAVKIIFNAVVNFLKSVFGPAFRWLHNNVIKPVWNGIKDTISGVWTFIRDKVFDPMKNAVTKTLPDAFRRGKDAIGKAWDGLKDVAKKPVRFVIDTIINKGVIGGFNKIASKFGAKEIDTFKLPKGFSAGGWTGPGRKYQPAGVVHADEYVLRKESQRKISRKHGRGFLDHLNRFGTLPAGYAKGGKVKGGTLIDAANWWVRKGARGSRHPAFGGAVRSGHSRNSLHYCVPLDTEILTDRGIISQSEVRVGDRTVGFNTETGKSEWTTIREVVRFTDAPLVRATNRNVDLRFTPNHRWIAESRQSEWRGFTTYREDGLTGGPCPECGENFPSLRGQSIHRNRMHGIKSTNPLPKRVKGSGGPVTVERVSRLAEFADLRSSDRIRLSAELDAEARNQLTVDEVRIIAWMMTDGSMIYGSSPRSPFHVDGSIYQKKPVHKETIHALLARAGVEHTFHERHNRDGVSSWSLRRAYVTDIVERAGLEDKDWSEFVLTLSTEQLHAFLQVCKDAEGASRTGGRQIAQSRSVNSTKSEAIALAAFLTGHSVGLGEDTIGLRRPHVQRGKLTVEDAGSEAVWCVVTDLGTWTMVQDGQTVLTGNSDRAVDLNYGPGGQNATEMAFFDRHVAEFKKLFPGIRVIWRAPGHYNHMHIDTANGADIGNFSGAASGGGVSIDSFLNPFKKLFGKVKAGVGNSAFGDVVGAGAKKIIEMPIQWIKDNAFKVADLVEGAVDTIKETAHHATVKTVAATYGWGFGPQWDAINWLVNKESSWNPKAANPRSSARGLFQKMTSIHGPIEKTVLGQARWGLRYIKDNYGTPTNAMRIHKKQGWYADGGFVKPVLFDRGGTLMPGTHLVANKTGKPEYILPAHVTDALINGRGDRGGDTFVFNGPDPVEAMREYELLRKRREALALV